MFRKLQLKLILIYTAVLIAILLVSNMLIYFTLTAYNTNQLTDDVERILVDINSSEWVTESYDENVVPRDIDDDDEPPSPIETQTSGSDADEDESEDSSKDIDEHEDNPKPDKSKEPEGTITPEETKTPEETETTKPSEDSDDEDEIDELDEVDELDEMDDAMLFLKSMIVLSSEDLTDYVEINTQVNTMGISTPETTAQNTIRFEDNTDLYIPNILNSFSYFFIYSNSGELLRWKSSDNELLNQMYSISLGLEIGQPPELIDLSDNGNGIYMVLKRPIIVDDVQLGYYSIGENVSAAYNTLDNLRLIMILVTIAGSIMSLGIGYLFAGRVIRPIKEAYKTKEKFIGDASHELRIPLSIILLSMEALKRKSINQDSTNEELILDVEAEALNMKDLVDKLLFIARNDSKSIKLNYEKINLSKVIDENIEKFKALNYEKHLTFNIRVDKDLIIQGDPKMIDSVVSILIDNAQKYNKENGEVSIDADTVFKGKKEYVRMTVSDTGIGISKKDIQKIFERFHRQDKSRSKNIPGYGLGLPIAKEILRLHQGTIEVESKIDIGSVFTVMFLKKN